MQLPDLSLLLVMAVFWATYAVLRAFVFRPLGTILEEREQTLEAAAAALSASVEKERDALARIDTELTRARRAAMALRESRRLEAAQARHVFLEEAREKTRVDLVAATASLEVQIASAREELSRDTRALALDIATAALGRRVA